MEKAQVEQEAFKETLKSMIEKSISAMGLARAADLEALEKRLAEMEKKLQGR